MTKAYDTYGFLSENMDTLAKELEPILGIKWVPHDSSFMGDYYQAESTFEESFTLQSNYYEPESDWMEPAFKDYPTLLYVAKTQRSEEIKRMILGIMKSGVALLSHELL